MTSRLVWTGLGPLLLSFGLMIVLTAWQVRVDRSVYARFFGAADPIGVMVVAALVGVVAMAHIQATSDLMVLGPGSSSRAAWTIVWVVPLLTAAAIGVDVVFGFAEDMNVAMPDALRFYPTIAGFVEIALHVLPISILVAVLGPPTGLDATFWRIAIPVALVEALLQAVYAISISTAIFSAVHLTVIGVLQVWMFWRFGFLWMFGLRLAYYSLWHLAWGVARLGLLF